MEIVSVTQNPLLPRVRLLSRAQTAQETQPSPYLLMMASSDQVPSPVFLGVCRLNWPFCQILAVAPVLLHLLTLAPHSPFFQ